MGMARTSIAVVLVLGLGLVGTPAAEARKKCPAAEANRIGQTKQVVVFAKPAAHGTYRTVACRFRDRRRLLLEDIEVPVHYRYLRVASSANGRFVAVAGMRSDSLSERHIYVVRGGFKTRRVRYFRRDLGASYAGIRRDPRVHTFALTRAGSLLVSTEASYAHDPPAPTTQIVGLWDGKGPRILDASTDVDAGSARLRHGTARWLSAGVERTAEISE
jgi:hypothetical protein